MAVSVPNVPGVPSVVFAPVTGLISGLLTSDAAGLFPGAPAAQWGIFRGGSAVVVCETVLTFDYRQQWVLSDFPLEEGAFETYNKVQTPYEVRFRFASGGGAAARASLLDSIAAIVGDYQVYNVVTPDAVYTSVNLSHYDYARAATNGLGLLTVDVWAQEIRLRSAGGGMGTTQDPASAAQVNGGPVQPVPATDAQVTLGTEIRGPRQELA